MKILDKKTKKKSIVREIKNREKKNKKFLYYANALNRQIDQLTPDTSKEKSEKTQEFFWMIEEYKISLFAPKIKTGIRVSEKKLDQFLMQLTTML